MAHGVVTVPQRIGGTRDGKAASRKPAFWRVTV
jgi:hypothetical protein